MYKIIALFGKSGSGKDTIQKWLVDKMGGNKIISHTTRPPRDYEKDGEDYHFVSNYAFAKKIYDGDMVEATEFNEWIYGTSIESLKLDKINIGVFNPNGIENLLEDNRVEVLPIYITASDKVRLLRCLTREKDPNCKEICRRYFSDLIDFKDLDFDYLHYNNNKKKKDFNNLIKKIKNTDFYKNN